MQHSTLIIALAGLSAASAYQLEMGDFWSKFSAFEMMSTCTGANVTRPYGKLVLKTLGECDRASSGPDADQAIASLDTANWTKIFNEYSPRFNRLSEFAPEKTERIEFVKKKLAQKIARFRCTMQKLNVTDSKNNINKTAIVEGYTTMDLPKALLTDLLAGVDQCYELTQCLPQEQRDDSPIPIDVLLVKTFINCERYIRNWACLKKFMLSYVAEGEFDFSGADGTLDFLPDDEARASAIVLANELVGGDDYGLYE